MSLCQPFFRDFHHVGVSWNGGTHRSSILIGFSWIFHYKQAIWGYPHFRKPPCHPMIFIISTSKSGSGPRCCRPASWWLQTCGRPKGHTSGDGAGITPIITTGLGNYHPGIPAIFWGELPMYQGFLTDHILLGEWKLPPVMAIIFHIFLHLLNLEELLV